MSRPEFEPNYIRAMDFGWVHFQEHVYAFLRTQVDQVIRSDAQKLATEELKHLPSDYAILGQNETDVEYLQSIFENVFAQVISFENALHDLAEQHISSLPRMNKWFGKPALFNPPTLQREVVSWFRNQSRQSDPLQPILTLIAHAPLGIKHGLGDNIGPGNFEALDLIANSEGPLTPIDLFDQYYELREWCTEAVLLADLEHSFGQPVNPDLFGSIELLFPGLVASARSGSRSNTPGSYFTDRNYRGPTL